MSIADRERIHRARLAYMAHAIALCDLYLGEPPSPGVVRAAAAHLHLAHHLPDDQDDLPFEQAA